MTVQGSFWTLLVLTTACAAPGAGRQQRATAPSAGAKNADAPAPGTPGCLADEVRLSKYQLSQERSSCRLTSAKDCLDRCKSGDSNACVEVALVLESEEHPLAAAAYANACRMGSHVGCVNYAAHRVRRSEEPGELACAYRLFVMNCRSGEPFGCGMQALALHRGTGVAQNKSAAASVAEVSCKQLGRFACSVYGSFLEAKGLSEAAAAAYQRACRTGDVQACQSRKGPTGL